MMSFLLHTSETHFQVLFSGFTYSNPHVWHEEANGSACLKYNIENENKATIDGVIIMPERLQTDRAISESITVKFGIWVYLSLVICHVTSKIEQTSYKLYVMMA